MATAIKTTRASKQVRIKGDIEITQDELKQVTGGVAKLPGLTKTSDITLKRGTM
jgi:bacteriocin-like protein